MMVYLACLHMCFSLLELRCQNRYACVCWNNNATAGTNRDVSCHIAYQYLTEC